MLNATAAATLPQLSPRHNAMLAEMGVPVWWSLGQSQAVAAPAPATGVRPPAPAVPMARAPAPVAIPLVPVSDVSGLDWPALQQAIAQCQACALGTQRRQAVSGMGDTQPDWLIVGEAPGEEEDRQGLPFVGRSGQLLDKMLRAMGLSRTQGVYIANVIKCRPPLNRNPEPQEVAQCSPYLLRQIALLRPKIVLTMGRFAAQAVLGQGGCYAAEALHRLPLGQLRGRIHQAQFGALNLPVVATYHPAYLLRSPAEKAKAWADLCLAMEVYAQQGR